MGSNPLTLVLLPGLGADARLFDPQRVDFPDLISPPWLDPERGESLSAYASRMATRVRDLLPPDHGPLILGGVSFGGMLAAEMAPLLKPHAVVLIGSALHPGEIAVSLRLMAMAGRWMPAPSGPAARVMARTFIRRLGPMTREQRRFLETMVDAVPYSFLQWATGAIFGWGGVCKVASKLVRLHGEHDRIIPFPRAHLVHKIVGAGHLPSVSHADEVNRHLRTPSRSV